MPIPTIITIKRFLKRLLFYFHYRHYGDFRKAAWQKAKELEAADHRWREMWAKKFDKPELL